MNHEQQIELINAMIQENADVTIKDYLEAKREIERIEIGTEVFIQLQKYEVKSRVTKNLANVNQRNVKAA